MKVNNREVPFDGTLGFDQIGYVWAETSPSNDGGGLVLEFSDKDLKAFASVCGVHILAGIVDLLTISLRGKGFKPNFHFTFDNTIFVTYSYALAPGEFGRCARCSEELEKFTIDLIEEIHCPNGCTYQLNELLS